MKSIFSACVLALGIVSSLTTVCAAQTSDPHEGLQQRPAAKATNPLRTMILSAVQAGPRVVAVGERGIVLLSDDDGHTWRQASRVPTTATLTSVVFIDDQSGWAVGHWGVILHTQDGGETWQLQRDDLGADQPLFSVWFKDAQQGFAAGLFSLLLTTHDGGKTWTPIKLPAEGSKAADVNLFRIFPDRQGNVLLAGEQGRVYRSRDDGASWDAMPTGAKGTFWTGRVLDDDSIVVAGLRGNVYRSSDAGASWTRIDVASNSSITDMIQLPNGDLLMVGMDGVTLLSKDRGATFDMQQRQDHAPLTAVVANSRGIPLFFSQSGIAKNNY